MKVFLSTAVIFIATTTLAFALETRLPVLSLGGKVSLPEERISAEVRLVANRKAPKYCFGEVELSDRSLFYPHVYEIKALTLSLFNLSYQLDIDLEERLREAISDSYSDLDQKVDQDIYFKSCGFRLDGITVNSSDTSLIIRDSFFNRVDPFFEVPRGTTRTADFSLNLLKERISLSVHVIEKREDKPLSIHSR